MSFKSLAIRPATWLYQRPYLLLTITMMAWAGNAIAGRGARFDVPPVTLAYLRWAGAFLITLPFAWPHLKRDMAMLRAHWKIVLVLSILGVSAFNTLLYTGLQDTSALNGALIQSANPVFIALSVFLFFREPARLLQIAGIAVSLLGVLIVITRGDIAVLRDMSFNRGDLWVLASVLVWAVYTALLRLRPPLHWLSFLTATFGIGCACLTPLLIGELISGRALNPTPQAFAAIAYVAVFPSIVAYICFNRGVELIGATRAGPFMNLVPLFVAGLAFVFLGEAPQLFHAAGFALVIGGIALAARKKDPALSLDAPGAAPLPGKGASPHRQGKASGG